MGPGHKIFLSLSLVMGNLLIIADASCEIKTFPVSFVKDSESSEKSIILNSKSERSKDEPVEHVKPVKNLLGNNHLSMTFGEPTKNSVVSSKYKYNLHSVLRMAVNWHPEIKRARSETKRLESAVEEVRAAYYPNVEMDLNSGVEKDGYTEDNNKTNKLNVSLEQMIYDFGGTGGRVELSELQVANAMYEVEKEINDILYQTTGAYLQTVRYYQLISAAKNRIDGFSKIKEITKKRTALGASAESDYSQASLRVAEATSNYNDYISQYNKWSATLDFLLNKYVSSKIIMELPAEVEKLYDNVLRGNLTDIDSPAFRIARKKIDIAKKEIDVQINGHYPKLTLTPYYEHDLTTQSSGNNVVKSRDRYGVFVNVKVPLYQGGSVSSKVQQARESLSSAQFNLDAEQNNARQKIMEYSSQMQNTKISLENKLAKEKSAIRTRDLYMSQYLELGNRSISDLTSAESEIHQTKVDIINSNYTVSNLSLESLYYAGKLINLLDMKG